MRYTVLTNDAGGVIDDVMVAKDGDDRLTLVVNAAGKEADVAHLRAGLPDAVAVEHRTDLALLALQGPAAAAVMARCDPAVADLVFMQTTTASVAGIPVAVSRSGYTGEDGFELAVAADRAVELAEALLAEPEVQLCRPGRPGLAAPRGRAVPLRPRPRPDDHPDRGRPGLDDPEAPPPGGAASPGPPPSWPSWPTGRPAAGSASLPRAASRCGTAPPCARPTAARPAS